VTSVSDRIEVNALGIGLGTAPVGTVYGPRSLDCFELLWMLSGTARWTGAGQTHRLAPGQVLRVAPQVSNTVEWQSGPGASGTTHGYVHFTLASGQVESGRSRILQPDEADVRSALLRYLSELARIRPPGWQGPAETAVGALLRLMESGTLLDSEPSVPLPEAVERAVAHVAQAWRREIRPVDLEELAAAASTSRGHLCRLFRSTFALGPVRCVDLLRLTHAAHLLSRSNLTVVQVAHICGYTSPYHFSRRFRAAFGVPPSGYRAGRPGGSADTVLRQHRLTPLANRIWPAPAGSIDAAAVSSKGKTYDVDY
jgi:AraC-like DNA-binding protein